MTKFTLFRSAQAVRVIIAADLADALRQCAAEMPAPKMMRAEEGAFQWVGDTPFELLPND